MRVLVALALFLQGCATAYTGPGPQSATDLPKFTFDDQTAHFGTRDAWFEVGPARERFTIASLRPTIEHVSPDALAAVDRARVWRRAQYGLLGVALLSVVLAFAVPNPYTSEFYTVGAVLLAGGAFAVNVHYDSLLREAAGSYNQGLRSAFRPGVAWTWSF